MTAFLDNIRCREKELSLKRKVLNSSLVTLLGIALGTLSKFLDTVSFSGYFDISNFLGRFAIWIFIAVCISVYSRSSVRAAINVLLFFTGMVSSYYLYSAYIAGFFPKSYAMIWVGFTVISPLLAFICWYAKGKGKISLLLSSVILAVCFNTSFVYGPGYFNWISPLEAVTFVCCLLILKRTTVRETAIMAGIALAMAIVLNTLLPYAL